MQVRKKSTSSQVQPEWQYFIQCCATISKLERTNSIKQIKETTIQGLPFGRGIGNAFNHLIKRPCFAYIANLEIE